MAVPCVITIYLSIYLLPVAVRTRYGYTSPSLALTRPDAGRHLLPRLESSRLERT